MKTPKRLLQDWLGITALADRLVRDDILRTDGALNSAVLEHRIKNPVTWSGSDPTVAVIDEATQDRVEEIVKGYGKPN